MLEEALTSPTFPPAEASLALLSFLRYELPAGGTAAEARFLRLFPLLIVRIVGELNAADGYATNEVGGWLGRSQRWSIAPSSSSTSGTGAPSNRVGGGGGTSGGGSSTRTAAGQQVRRPGSPGGVRRSGGGIHGGSGTSQSSLDADPVVQLLSAGRKDDFAASALQRASPYQSFSSLQQQQQQQPRQPTLIDAVSDESVHRPGVRFAFPLQALPLPTQAAFLYLLLEGGGASGSGAGGAAPFGRGSPTFFQQQQQQQQQQHGAGLLGGNVRARPNASRLLGSVLRVPSAEQPELRYALQRQVQLFRQQRMVAQQQGGTSPGVLSSQQQQIGGLMTGATAAGAGGGAATVLPLPADARAAVMLSMLEYYLMHFIRFAAVGQSSSSSSSGASSSAAASGQGRSGSTGGTAAYRPTSSSSRSPYGEQVFLHLLRSYSARYLPHSDPVLPPSSSLHRSKHSGSVRSAGPSTLSPSFLDLDRDSELFLRLCVEFWLDGGNWTSCAPTTSDAMRCCLPIGLGGNRSAAFSGTPMTPASPLPGAAAATAATADIDLDMSSDLANVLPLWGDTTAAAATTTSATPPTPYGPPPHLVRRCVRILVNHLVSDPAIGNAAAGEAAYAPQRGIVGGVLGTAASSVTSRSSSRGAGGITGGSNVGPAPSGGPAVTAAGGSVDWCLTPAMTIVQPSFYNYVRMNLRHAPVHVADSPFFSALNSWLVWLEPWNVVLRKSRPTASNFSSPSKAKNFLLDTVSSSVSGQSRAELYASSVVIPKAASASKYTYAWEPYIAANLYMYAVPLAIFLRRARELDFSSRDFHRSLGHVQRVFRVFSPPVVDAISRLLTRQSGTAHLSNLVAQHERVLGEFCPPTGVGGLSLSSCSQDMHNLLEEIYLQHRKKVRELDFFDRFASKLEGLAGQGTKGDELALDKLLAQARKIADLPADYEVLPGEKLGARGRGGGLEGTEKVDRMKPERVHGGFLTESGRQQIVAGTRKCSALDVAFVGDPMHARVRSYEIPFLVSWTIKGSDWLNDRLGLVPLRESDESETAPTGDPDTSALLLKLFKEGEDSKRLWFRFNFRFLANYRTIVWIFLAFLWFVIRR